MTLVELLVVLTILGLITTVAVTSTDLVMGQGRYESTIRTLGDVALAAVGPVDKHQVDGTVAGGGFLADLGRLPVAIGSDPATSLAELWSNPNGLLPFAIRPAPTDPEVLVASGWRGPYLRLPLGRTELRDGWGHPFSLATNGTGEVIGLSSLGADAQAGGSGLDADLPLSLSDRPTTTVSGNVYLVDAVGTRTNPTGTVIVRMYGPDPATGGVRQLTADIAVSADGVVSYQFAQPVAPGPHHLRAYLGDPATKKSAIQRVQQTDVYHLEFR